MVGRRLPTRNVRALRADRHRRHCVVAFIALRLINVVVGGGGWTNERPDNGALLRFWTRLWFILILHYLVFHCCAGTTAMDILPPLTSVHR